MPGEVPLSCYVDLASTALKAVEGLDRVGPECLPPEDRAVLHGLLHAIEGRLQNALAQTAPSAPPVEQLPLQAAVSEPVGPGLAIVGSTPEEPDFVVEPKPALVDAPVIEPSSGAPTEQPAFVLPVASPPIPETAASAIAEVSRPDASLDGGSLENEGQVPSLGEVVIPRPVPDGSAIQIFEAQAVEDFNILWSPSDQTQKRLKIEILQDLVVAINDVEYRFRLPGGKPTIVMKALNALLIAGVIENRSHLTINEIVEIMDDPSITEVSSGLAQALKGLVFKGLIQTYPDNQFGLPEFVQLVDKRIKPVPSQQSGVAAQQSVRQGFGGNGTSSGHVARAAFFESEKGGNPEPEATILPLSTAWGLQLKPRSQGLGYDMFLNGVLVNASYASAAEVLKPILSSPDHLTFEGLLVAVNLVRKIPMKPNELRTLLGSTCSLLDEQGLLKHWHEETKLVDGRSQQVFSIDRSAGLEDKPDFLAKAR